MKRAFLLLLLSAVACASASHRSVDDETRKSTGPSPPPPPDAFARNCGSLVPFPDEERKPMSRTFVMTCPLPPVYTWQQVAKFALAPAARLAVLLESERFYGAPEPSERASQFNLVFYYPLEEIDRDWLTVDPPPKLFSVDAGTVLSGQELQSLREKVAIQHEDAAYGECRTLVLDVAKSSKDPRRAQACANAMAMIDRARSMRQEARYRQQQAEFQQRQLQEAERQRQEMERLEEQIEASRQEAERRERKRRIGEAIQNAARAYQEGMQRPSGDMHCRPDLLGGMDCKSR